MNTTERNAIEWGPPIAGEVMRSLSLPADTPVRKNLYGVVGEYREWGFVTGSDYSLRADHPHYALTEMQRLGQEADARTSSLQKAQTSPQQPDWTPCERTVRHVADMVEAWSRNGLSDETNFILAAAAADIRRTIPKKDPAEEWVNEFIGSGHDNPDIDTDARMKRFARWLVSKEKLA